MKDALTKLIKVKTIVTIILTVVFAVLSIIGRIEPQQFLTIFAVIISFYFGTVAERQTTKRTADTQSGAGTSETSGIVDYGTLESEMEATEDDTINDTDAETDTEATVEDNA